MNFLSFFEPIYYEFLAKFVPRRVIYTRHGECLKCGKCCRYMYCNGLGSRIEFSFLQFIYPEYRRFRIVGKDESGNFVISCTLIGKENICPVYESRAAVCRNYPAKSTSIKGALHAGCGFFRKPEKTFKEFLS